MNKDIAFKNTIFQGVVGSTAHGTGLDGKEDRDEMGVFIEPCRNVCGLQSVDRYISRTQPDGVRSGPGDIDLTMYSLRKFCRLAIKGNPSVTLLLWLPEYMAQNYLGKELVSMRRGFISKEAGERHLGYLISQKRALLGERSKKVTRPELVAEFGYDTKFAMHALRLGMQGIEFLTEGSLSVPIKEPNRSTLLDVRKGKPSFKEVIEMIESVEADLKTITEKYNGKADVVRVENFLMSAHQRHWMDVPC